MSNQAPNHKTFFAELKRRNVFRVMAVYGIVGFILLQVLDLAVPALLLPEWTYRFAALILLIGFPIAVVIAWAFESTPEGVKRTADAAPEEISAILAQPVSHRWPAGLLALAGVLLLFGSGWWMGQRGEGGRDLSLAIPEANASEFRTLAVLPFENVGGDEENRVLASGLHMDLQDQLGRLADLRVTSPMSVREYESSEKGIQEIADELGVDHILQGSVRRSAKQVRVAVQLIDAATKENLWFDQFDREVTPENLFEIQSDIARRVAEHLEARLSPEDIQRLEAGPSTDNLAALNWYHRARSAFWSSDESIKDAAAYAERAVDLEPEFVEAWSFLARIRAVLVLNGEDEQREATLEAVKRAESIAPGSLEAIAARGYHTYYVESELESAMTLFRQAERMAPSDADIVQIIGWLQGRAGDFAEGARTMRRAAELDPQNASRLEVLAGSLRGMGRYEAADDVIERAMAIDPSSGRESKVGTTLARYRDIRRARGLASEMGLDPADWGEGNILAWLAIYDRDYEAATDALTKMPSDELDFLEALRLQNLAMVEQLKGGDLRPYTDSLQVVGDISFSFREFTPLLAARTLLLSGQQEDGLARLREAVTQARASTDQRASHTTLSMAAGMYAYYGRQDEALEIFEEIVDRPGDGSVNLAGLQLDPGLDGLRADPRFDAILQRRAAFEAQAAIDAEADGPWVP